MFGWIKKQFGRKPPSTWSIRDWQRVLSTGQVPGDVSVNTLLRNSAVVACASVIADSIAAAPIYVTQQAPGGGLRTVTNSSASDPLRSLTYDDMSCAVFGACTVGTGFLHLNGITLRALDSNRTSAHIDDGGRIWLRQGTDAYISADDVAAIRFRYAAGYYLGYSPLLLAQDSLKGDLAIARMASAMATNAQHPGVALEFPGILSDKAAENIRSSWGDAVGGDRQGGIVVLESGVKIAKLGYPSAVDSQLTQALEWSASDIARVFAVPNDCLNPQSDSNRATSAEAARSLVQRCLKPWAARIGDALSRLLLTDAERAAGLSVAIDLEELALGQGEERARYARELVAAGVCTPNEMRNSLGFEDDPAGDELRFPLNTATAAQAPSPGDKRVRWFHSVKAE